jgi:hypothetical protein
MCRGVIGNFEDRGLVTFQTNAGAVVELLRWTCNYCGFTILFDPSAPRQSQYRGEGTEQIPDFE